MSKAKRQAIATSIIFLVILLITATAALFLDVPKFYSLVRYGRLADGVVISKQRENHMSIFFEYRVDDHFFQSVGRAEDIGKSFDAIQIGEAVPIYYDSTDPASATMGDPNKYLKSSIIGTCFILGGLVLCVLLYALKRR